jgi:hypothetical protein
MNDERLKKEKTSFWASESEKPLFDLYHEWMGTPPTNPLMAEKLVMFSAAKHLEISIIKRLQSIGLVQKQEDDKQLRFEMERQGIKVSGYYDGVFVDGTPVEIKTFYGEYQATLLKEGNPKPSYLKQLAIYMDSLDKNLGKLIYLDRGTGEMYEFDLRREPNSLRFKSMAVEFDLNDTYNRWAKLYKNHVAPKIEPPSEYKYKKPLHAIDWSKVSRSDISKARNNHKVIGDWEALYSPYKSLIIEREGTTLGYSLEELEQIKRLTTGYSKR